MFLKASRDARLFISFFGCLFFYAVLFSQELTLFFCLFVLGFFFFFVVNFVIH